MWLSVICNLSLFSHILLRPALAPHYTAFIVAQKEQAGPPPHTLLAEYLLWLQT